MGAHGVTPFPAIDPEPPPRLTRLKQSSPRTRWSVAGVALTAAAVATVLLVLPNSGPPNRPAAAKFSDRSGLVVFKDQGSGQLGTAAPDGSGAALLNGAGTLAGEDTPVESPDARSLVTLEGQIVTVSQTGSLTVGYLPSVPPNQVFNGPWAAVSFANGGRELAEALCDGTDPWQALLVPVASASGVLLGHVDANYDSASVAGDPRSAGAFTIPARPGGSDCSGGAPPRDGDPGVVFDRQGRPPRMIITAAAVSHALGSPTGTPVLLSVFPSPDGNLLAITASTFTVNPHPGPTTPEVQPNNIGMVVTTRTGTIVAATSRYDGYLVSWSPDSREIAMAMMPRNAAPAKVVVWTPGGATRTIALPGHHGESATVLLWSPDGQQLIYAAQSNAPTLTTSQAFKRGWTVIDLRTGQVHEVKAAGQPAAWLPAAGRR